MMATSRGILVLAMLLLCAGVPAQSPEEYWRDASLYRDEWGVPHVYADTPRAMAFVFGYAQAQDHLDGMLLAYRVAKGRAAEVLGEPYADSDAFALKMNHARLAHEAIHGVDPLTQELCLGFAQGVNFWMSTHPNQLPPYAESVQPADILALWHAFLMGLAPLELPGVYKPAPSMHSGNAWAMAPFRMQEGKSTLVINPHQYYEGYFQWYEAHLVLADMNVAGVTLQGLPVILQGHNDVLGWGLTPNMPDFADIFMEEVEKPDLKIKDPRIKAMIPVEQLMLLDYFSNATPYLVRTQGGTEERFVPAYVNERGPIFEAEGNRLFSWKVGGYYQFGGLYQLVQMARAPSLEAFQQALTLHQLPCFHITYADAGGNIFYLYNTRAGHRIAPEVAVGNEPVIPQNWGQPVHWGHAEYAWSGVIPVPALPQILNPPTGYIQACGNPPWLATDNLQPTPGSWPPWLFRDVDTPEAQRVRQLLRHGTRNFRDQQAMIFDTVVPLAAELTAALLKAVDATPGFMAGAHPDLAAGLDSLRYWNYMAEPDAAGMTFFRWWLSALESQHAAIPAGVHWREWLVEDTAAAQQLLLQTAEEAARKMRNDYDAGAVPWGAVHRVQRGTLDAEAAGTAHGASLFRMNDYTLQGNRLYADYGFGYALAVQFGVVPDAVSLSAFGASSRPASPHYADQFTLLRERRFKKNRFQDADVWRHAERALGKSIILLPLGVEGAFWFHSVSPSEIRLVSRADAPAELPESHRAYTVFVQPEWTNWEQQLDMELEFYIPPELCPKDSLDTLSIWAYTLQQGWYALPEQSFERESGLLWGEHDGTGIYAVLGPLELPGRPEQESATTENVDTAEESIADTPAPATEISPTSDAPKMSSYVPRPLREQLQKEATALEEYNDIGYSSDSGAKGKKFWFKREDTEKPEEAQVAPKSNEEAFSGPKGRRTFHIERHDTQE